MALVGCADDPAPAGEDGGGEGGAFVPCTPEDDIVCHQICLTGRLVTRECGFEDLGEPCATAADPLPACADGRECTPAGQCVVANECDADSDCEPTEGDGGHIQICVSLDGGARTCELGCNSDDQCRGSGDLLPSKCLGGPGVEGRCEACTCQTHADCATFGEEGKLYSCAPERTVDGGSAAECQCGEVGCRPGFADCEDGFVCNPLAFQCESESCLVHDDCADEHKHCKRDRGEASGKCVCPDDRSTGECPDPPKGCRNTAQCQDWLGETSICLDWTCQEQPCLEGDDCTLLGTACGDDGFCVPQSCATDEECPRRRDIIPLPSGVFWCDDTDGPGTCAVGCRDHGDCEETHKCDEHECIQRTCAGPNDCALGRWCNPNALGAPEGAGLCEEGCDELRDCPQAQPCRLDRHLCGCAFDGDCAIINPDEICNPDGTCGPPCRSHDDCAGDEACVDRHCYEGTCRNDPFETNDNKETAFTFLRPECDPAEDLGCLVPCEDDEGSLCGSFSPRLCSEPPPVPDLTQDVADWFAISLNRFEELEIEIVWPLVDTDGDGVGDAPGACDLDITDLAPPSTSLLRPGDDDPERLARAWPRPGYEFAPPGPNQPCRMLVETHVPAPRAQTYWLAVENPKATQFDYGLNVRVRTSLECEDDRWENNDAHADARSIFECAEFIVQGGHLQDPVGINGHTLCENDSDWYELELRAGDRVSVVATYDNRLGELRARLRPPSAIVDPAVNLILEDVVGRDGVLELFESDEQDTVADGPYLLEITQGSQANIGIPLQVEYDLHVACEGPSVPCQADAEEPNDAFARAHCVYQRRRPEGCDPDDDQLPCVLTCVPIPENGGVPTVYRRPDPQDADDTPQHLCAEGDAPDGRDEDWYKFIVGDGGQVSVVMENDLGPGGFWYLEVELQNDEGEVLNSSRNAGALNAFNRVGLLAGTYYIRVMHPANVLEDRTVPYDLTISVFGAPPLCSEDAFEENDDFESARTIRFDLGNPELDCILGEDEHFALCAPPLGQNHDEEDWFVLDLTGTVVERVEVELRCQEGDDLFIEMRGEDGLLSCPRNILPDRACRDLSLGCGEGVVPRRMDLIRPRGEEQRIKVFGINDAQNEYDLCVRVIADICADDDYENNDVCAQATLHDVDDSPYLNQFRPLESFICPGDDDYYVFRPNQAPGVDEHETYDIRVLVVTSNDADLDVQLLDKRCNRFNPLVEDLGLSQDICLLYNNARAADDFYVRVYGADVLSEADYTVKVDIGAPGSLGCL